MMELTELKEDIKAKLQMLDIDIGNVYAKLGVARSKLKQLLLPEGDSQTQPNDS
ncbi:MAG: hypothetical protein VB878_13975 [Pirellulaceae bacterium]